MGVCTSTKKNKEVTANKKENENENNSDKKKEDKENNSGIKDENEEKKEEENKKSDFSQDSDKISDKEDEEKKKEEENNDAINSNIIINYVLNGKTEFQEIFKINDNISSIFDLLPIKISKYAEYDLMTKDNLSLLTKLNEKINTIFIDVESAEVYLSYLGLDITNNIRKEYEKSNSVIGIPLFDLGGDIGILIFHKKEKNFTIEILKNNKLSEFNHLSSICNGKNILYLSGGDNGKSTSTNFFSSIDLLNINSIMELPKLKIARSWHSMIYLPKKYIYIVGGGTDEAELYDIEKKTIKIDSKMNEIRNECTLFLMNTIILYAFCGISDEGSFLPTVESCNLRQKERTWSYVKYSSIDNTIFEECFYVGAFFSDTSLILFASNEDDKKEFKNLLFDLEDEENPTLRAYDSGGKIVDVVPEKIFHSFGQNISYMIPLVGTKAKIYKIDESLKLNIDYFPEILKSIIE